MSQALNARSMATDGVDRRFPHHADRTLRHVGAHQHSIDSLDIFWKPFQQSNPCSNCGKTVDDRNPAQTCVTKPQEFWRYGIQGAMRDLHHQQEVGHGAYHWQLAYLHSRICIYIYIYMRTYIRLSLSIHIYIQYKKRMCIYIYIYISLSLSIFPLRRHSHTHQTKILILIMCQ